MVITARFSASDRCRNHPKELSNSSWSLVCKICSLGRISTIGMFDILAYISTTRRAMDKWRLQPNSAHQIGSETPFVSFLIVGWCCLIDGWKYWPEFFTLECLCLLLNNQGRYWQMNGTAGFNSSNRSRTNPPQSSDSRLVMVYKGVKIQPNWGGIFVSRNFVFWLVSQAPRDLWINGGDRRIQRIKLV